MAFPARAPIDIAAVDALVFRAPIDVPVLASFGRMDARPMVLVRIEDRDGAVGWGEVWCNFPSCGAEHRAKLVTSLFKPLLAGRRFEGPAASFEFLTSRLHVLAIQTGEPGPIAQCIAGIDVALWDLAARRAGLPVWRLLGGGTGAIRVYASGLNPDGPELLAAQKRAEGHTRFKLKIGFDAGRDLDNLRRLRATLGSAATLMVDANQAWDPPTARERVAALDGFALGWLEEPLAADVPWAEWQRLAATTSIPLAAGENVMGFDGFDAALAAGAVRIVQPDLAKWGGFTGCVRVARAAVAAGRRFCPHYLGGGWGLRASAHLLAAVGGDGVLEVDANPNPLRTLLCGPLAKIVDGASALDDSAGLGAPPDLDALREFAAAA